MLGIYLIIGLFVVGINWQIIKESGEDCGIYAHKNPLTFWSGILMFILIWPWFLALMLKGKL